MDKATAKIRAYKNPSTANPLTMDEANKIRIAFIIKVKSPRVNKLIGRVIITNNGFRVILINPKTIAKTKAVQTPPNVMPGIK